MNHATISGNLCKDPDYRTTASGKGLCTFKLAVRRDKDNTDFIPVVVWNRGKYLLADYCHNELRKGKKATANGRIQTRSYDTANGDTRYITEVVADEVEWEKEKQGSGTPNQFKVDEEKQQFEPLDDEQMPF